MPRWIPPLLVGLVIALVATGSRLGVAVQREGAARADAREAIEIAGEAVARATRISESARAWRTHADSLVRVARASDAAARGMEVEAAQHALDFHTEAEAAHDTCRAVIAAGERTILALQAVSDTLRLSARRWESSSDDYRLLYLRSDSVATDLHRALTNLRSATSLVIEERKSWRDRVAIFLPKPGLGGGCGVAARGGMDCITGFTLSFVF